MYKSKKKLFKNYLKILFFIISFVNKVVYELLYRIKLAKYFYSEIYIQLETADKYIRKHNYTQAAMIYKEIIGKQPTLSTIYSLGIKVSKKGGINNEFFHWFNIITFRNHIQYSFSY